MWNTEVEGFLESIAYVLGDLESFKAVTKEAVLEDGNVDEQDADAVKSFLEKVK